MVFHPQASASAAGASFIDAWEPPRGSLRVRCAGRTVPRLVPPDPPRSVAEPRLRVTTELCFSGRTELPATKQSYLHGAVLILRPCLPQTEPRSWILLA